jgi:hypothetical protein
VSGEVDEILEEEGSLLFLTQSGYRRKYGIIGMGTAERPCSAEDA